MAALYTARLAAAGAAGAAAGHLLARSEARPAAPAGPLRPAAAGLSREERMRIPAWAGAGATGGLAEGSWEELDLHSRYGESLSGNAVHDTLLVRPVTAPPPPRPPPPAPRPPSSMPSRSTG